MKKLLTVEEAAELLQVTPRTVKNWIKNDSMNFPVTKLGRLVRIDADMLSEWISNNSK